MITANTFRTHARNLQALGQEHRAGELTMRAVELARQAAGEIAYVAGSIAPLEDCYSPQLTPSEEELTDEHEKMVAHLVESQVDFLLIETQVTIREACIAGAAAARTGIPFGISFVCGANGCLLSGEPLLEAYQAVLPLAPSVFLVNCLPAEDVLRTLDPVLGRSGGPLFGAYANTGRMTATGVWESTSGQNPAVYAEIATEWMTRDLKIIGWCCGTGPEHISALKRIV